MKREKDQDSSVSVCNCHWKAHVLYVDLSRLFLIPVVLSNSQTLGTAAPAAAAAPV